MSDTNEWSYSRCRGKTKLEYCAHIAKLEIEMGAVAASRDYMEKEMEFYKRMYRELVGGKYDAYLDRVARCTEMDPERPNLSEPKSKNPFIGGPLSDRKELCKHENRPWNPEGPTRCPDCGEWIG